MLSKEEISNAKEKCNSIIEFCKNNKECQKNKICPDCYIEIEDIKAMKILLQYIDQLENQIQAKEMEHEYDVNMIDEVKGNSVKLYKEIRKQNKMIDEMLDEYEYNVRCNFKNFCDEEMKKDKCIQDCRICIKQYFEKKVEEK